MFHRLKGAVRTTKLAAFGLAALALAACDGVAVPKIGGGGAGPRVDTSKPVTVALLVPLGSGNAQQEGLANSLVNAARMAVADVQGAQIDLRVYSTAGNADRAAIAAARAADEGAKIIIGPLFAEAANAAGAAVAARDINVLSFSNNTQIAGGNVFVLGNTFQNTAERLMRFASGQGIRSFGAVTSDNVAGQIAASAVQQAAASTGTTFTGNTSYEFSPDGIIAAIPRIKSQVSSTGTQGLVLDATSSGALPLYAQLLPEAGLDQGKVKFIGLTRWDIPPQTLGLSGLNGGWFAIPNQATYQAFANRYAGQFGGQPHSLASISYDGVAAVGALLADGGRNALSRSNLTRRSGFAGATGIFRLNANGTNERGLAVAEVNNGAIKIVSPAPRSFGGAGS